MIDRNVGRVLSWCIAGVLAYFLFRVFQPFLVPLVWASVLAIFFFPLYRGIGRFITRPSLAALATVGAIAVLLVAPMVLVTQAIVGEAVSFIGWLHSGDVLANVDTLARRYLSALPVRLESLQQIATDLTRTVGTFLAQQSARFASNLAWFLFELTFMLFALFYFLRDGKALVRFIRSISPLGADGHEHLATEVTELIQVTIFSSFIVAGVQGTLGGLSFWLLGIPSPALWAVLMAILALLPVAGPWLVWAPVAAGLILTGHVTRGIVLLVLGFLLVSGADNVLRPALIAGRSQLNGLLVFISVLGGVQAFGLVGVVLGPVVVAAAAGLLKRYRQNMES